MAGVEFPPFLPPVAPRDPYNRLKPAVTAGFMEYRHGDSNPGFRRERAAS
jgi:hypothetical protein